jgi:CO/xanthine dehydrogenase FAD-binding subunit
MERNVLRPGEVIGWIEIPPATGLQVDYDKLAVRNALDFPSLGVAVGVRRDAAGQPLELSVALTGLGTHPGCWRHAIADGASLPKVVAKACARAGKFATTYQQDFFPRDYRKKMIGVFIHRSLRRLGV